MVDSKSRGDKIGNIIKSFLLDEYEESVLLDIVEDPYCIVFCIKPYKEGACGVELTVGLSGDESLTILIGNKMVYEEYDGMTIPQDSIFIRLLLLAVSNGKLEEMYIYTGKGKVDYKAIINVGCGLDIRINDDLKIDKNVRMKTVNYQPW